MQFVGEAAAAPSPKAISPADIRLHAALQLRARLLHDFLAAMEITPARFSVLIGDRYGKVGANLLRQVPLTPAVDDPVTHQTFDSVTGGLTKLAESFSDDPAGKAKAHLVSTLRAALIECRIDHLEGRTIAPLYRLRYQHPQDEVFGKDGELNPTTLRARRLTGTVSEPGLIRRLLLKFDTSLNNESVYQRPELRAAADAFVSERAAKGFDPLSSRVLAELQSAGLTVTKTALRPFYRQTQLTDYEVDALTDGKPLPCETLAPKISALLALSGVPGTVSAALKGYAFAPQPRAAAPLSLEERIRPEFDAAIAALITARQRAAETIAPKHGAAAAQPAVTKQEGQTLIPAKAAPAPPSSNNPKAPVAEISAPLTKAPAEVAETECAGPAAPERPVTGPKAVRQTKIDHSAAVAGVTEAKTSGSEPRAPGQPLQPVAEPPLRNIPAPPPSPEAITYRRLAVELPAMLAEPRANLLPDPSKGLQIHLAYIGEELIRTKRTALSKIEERYQAIPSLLKRGGAALFIDLAEAKERNSGAPQFGEQEWRCIFKVLEVALPGVSITAQGRSDLAAFFEKLRQLQECAKAVSESEPTAKVAHAAIAELKGSARAGLYRMPNPDSLLSRLSQITGELTALNVHRLGK